MLTSTQTDALWPALLEAKRAMAPVHKGKKNDHFKYTYANEEAWFDAVQPALLAHGLVLTFSIISSSRTGTLTTVQASARITHAPSGQWIEVYGVGEGEDKNDKAAYKAMTGAKKYLYALAFSLPTTDDVEDPAHDKKRAAELMAAQIRASKPDSLQAEINGALVAAGHDPLPDPETAEKRARCKALYEQAKKIDKDEARIISKRYGSDWDRIAEELQLFIDGAPKGTK